MNEKQAIDLILNKVREKYLSGTETDMRNMVIDEATATEAGLSVLEWKRALNYGLMIRYFLLEDSGIVLSNSAIENIIYEEIMKAQKNNKVFG